MRDIEVRLARSDEHDILGTITVDAYVTDGFDPRSDYARVLRDSERRAHDAVLLATVAGDEIIGSVTYCPSSAAMNNIARPDEAEVRMLAVVPAARRRGVGEALVWACIDRAAADGLRSLVLSSKTEMTAAQRVYERLGFIRTPQRDWSPVPGLPLITYALVLDHGR